jgi:hypothetical protein
MGRSSKAAIDEKSYLQARVMDEVIPEFSRDGRDT